MEREITQQNYMECLAYAVRLVEKSPLVGNYHQRGELAAHVNSIARDLYKGIKSYGNTGADFS